MREDSYREWQLTRIKKPEISTTVSKHYNWENSENNLNSEKFNKIQSR